MLALFDPFLNLPSNHSESEVTRLMQDIQHKPRVNISLALHNLTTQGAVHLLV